MTDVKLILIELMRLAFPEATTYSVNLETECQASYMHGGWGEETTSYTEPDERWHAWCVNGSSTNVVFDATSSTAESLATKIRERAKVTA